jgi:hypothetical protein
MLTVSMGLSGPPAAIRVSLPGLCDRSDGAQIRRGTLARSTISNGLEETFCPSLRIGVPARPSALDEDVRARGGRAGQMVFGPCRGHWRFPAHAPKSVASLARSVIESSRSDKARKPAGKAGGIICARARRMMRATSGDASSSSDQDKLPENQFRLGGELSRARPNRRMSRMCRRSPLMAPRSANARSQQQPDMNERDHDGKPTCSFVVAAIACDFPASSARWAEVANAGNSTQLGFVHRGQNPGRHLFGRLARSRQHDGSKCDMFASDQQWSFPGRIRSTRPERRAIRFDTTTASAVR